MKNIQVLNVTFYYKELKLKILIRQINNRTEFIMNTILYHTANFCQSG